MFVSIRSMVSPRVDLNISIATYIQHLQTSHIAEDRFQRWCEVCCAADWKMSLTEAQVRIRQSHTAHSRKRGSGLRSCLT
jgi:hypothetical protein